MELNFNFEPNKNQEKKSLFDSTEPPKKLSLFNDNKENNKSLFGDLFSKNTESNFTFNNLSLFGDNNNNNSGGIFGNKNESLFGNNNLFDNKNKEKDNVQKKKENKKLFDDNEYQKSIFNNINLFEDTHKDNVQKKKENKRLFDDNENQKSIFNGINLFEDTEQINSNNNKISLFGNINKKVINNKKNNDSDEDSDNNDSDKNDKEDEEEDSEGDKDGYECDNDEDEEEEEDSENNKLKNNKKIKNKNKKEKSDKEEESSSSNYHPENEQNFYDNLDNYMSSDSDLENISEGSTIYGDSDSEEDKDKQKKKICDHLKLVKEKRTLRKKNKRTKKNNNKNNNDESDSDNEEEIYDENSQLFKETELKTFLENTFLFEKIVIKKKKEKLFDFKINDKKESKENEKDSDEKSDSSYENEKNNELTIEFNEKYSGKENNLSLNYYTKKTKLENLNYMKKVNFNICKKIPNSENYLMYDENKEKLYAYNSKKKTIISKSIFISSFEYLYDEFFLIVDSKEENMIIFHYDEKENKFIIDQTLDLPEEKDLDIHGPFAPYLNVYPFNEKFILFHWGTANNFYIYKNYSKNNDKIIFKNYKNIGLVKEAFVYLNTKLDKLLKINDNEFMVYAVSDQRPEADNIWEAFMRGGSKHKEASYIAIYSYNNILDEFILTKSKVIYESKNDYTYSKGKYILRERFFIYSGDIRKTEKKYIQIFDLKTMQIMAMIITEKNDGFFTINLNDVLFVASSDIIKQYEIKENGFIKQIGEIKRISNFNIFEKRDNGFVYKNDNGDFYLLEHN